MRVESGRTEAPGSLNVRLARRLSRRLNDISAPQSDPSDTSPPDISFQDRITLSAAEAICLGGRSYWLPSELRALAAPENQSRKSGKGLLAAIRTKSLQKRNSQEETQP
jgi:hypothetical protein